MRPDTNILYLSFICALLRAKKITFEQIHNGLGPPPPAGGTLTSQRLSIGASAVIKALQSTAEDSDEPRATMIVHMIRERLTTGKSSPNDLQSIVRSATTDTISAETMMIAYFGVLLEYEPMMISTVDALLQNDEDTRLGSERSLVPNPNLTFAISMLRMALLERGRRFGAVDQQLHTLQLNIRDGKIRHSHMKNLLPEDNPDDVPTETPRPYRVD